MNASNIFIYVSQKTQTVPAKVRWQPWSLPCVRPQSDVKCYRLGSYDLGSGS